MSSAVLLSQALYQGCSVRSSLSSLLLLLLLLLLLGTRDTAAVVWFQMELGAGVGGRHRLLYLPKYYIKHGGGKTESGLKLLKHTYHFLLEVSPVEAGLVWSLELPQLG